jgi:heme A synthase
MTMGRGYRRLALAAVIATYLLVIWGGVVRVTGSGLGCGATNDWPLCHGQLLPPLRQDALIEFTHRWLAALSVTLVLLLAAVTWLRHRDRRALSLGMAAVVALFVVQIILGAITVKLRLPGYVILAHLGNALILLAALVAVATAAFAGPAVARMTPVWRTAALAAGATYLLVRSGAFVVAQGAGAGCSGWPLCGDGLQLPAGEVAVINVAHRVVAGIVLLVVGYAMAMVRRGVPRRSGAARAAMVVNVVLVGQVLAGAAVVELRLPPLARGIHLALASGLWALVVLVTLLCRNTEAVAHSASPSPGRSPVGALS